MRRLDPRLKHSGMTKAAVTFVLALFCCQVPQAAFAAKNFNVMNNTSSFLFVNGTTGNVGIGTTTPQGGFVVTNGNVGIGTWAPAGALIVGSGNVGIGSITPGVPLDIIYNSNNGGVRIIGSDDVNIITEITQLQNLGVRSGVINLYDGSTKTVHIGSSKEAPDSVYFNTGNVGIGTTTPQGAFTVTNGNVGIGTFAPTNGFVYNNCASHSGQAACWATNGAAGYCTGAVGAGGACSCTAC